MHAGWCNLYGPYSCPPEFLWERFLHFHFDKGILLGPNSFSTRPVMVHAWLIDHWRENRVSGGKGKGKNKRRSWRQTEEGRMKNEGRRDKENGGGVKSQGLHQQKQTSLLTRHWKSLWYTFCLPYPIFYNVVSIDSSPRESQFIRAIPYKQLQSLGLLVCTQIKGGEWKKEGDLLPCLIFSLSLRVRNCHLTNES